MSEKWTPGPHVVMNGRDVFTALGAKNRKCVEASNSDGWHLADCACGVTYDKDGQERTLTEEEILANATTTPGTRTDARPT